jgi:hypothetical protein
MLRLLLAVALVFLAIPTASGMGWESLGSHPFEDTNYKEWPNVLPVINDRNRVYHSWVNGDERFYFAGDTEALNASLKNFSGIKAERLTVVLHPGPGKTGTFNNRMTFTFNWQLHLLGGIATVMAKEHLGDNIWDPTPYMHVYVGEAIKLDEIDVPAGVNVLEIADLQTRYAKCLASNDRTVRGWSCGRIAGLDPYDAESMRKVAAMLDDQDDWVKLNAAGALSVYTGVKSEAIQRLQAVKTDDDQLKKQIGQSIESLQEAELSESARKRFGQSLASIHELVAKHRQER